MPPTHRALFLTATQKHNSTFTFSATPFREATHTPTQCLSIRMFHSSSFWFPLLVRHCAVFLTMCLAQFPERQPRSDPPSHKCSSFLWARPIIPLSFDGLESLICPFHDASIIYPDSHCFLLFCPHRLRSGLGFFSVLFLQMSHLFSHLFSELHSRFLLLWSNLVPSLVSNLRPRPIPSLACPKPSCDPPANVLCFCFVLTAFKGASDMASH